MWFNDWVEVRKRKGGKGSEHLELLLSFRDGNRILGPIVAPYPSTGFVGWADWLHPPRDEGGLLGHVYPTRNLSKAQADAIASSLSSRFGKDHVVRFERPFHIVRLRDIPHHEFQSLPSDLSAPFLSGNYTAQARWSLGWPLRKVIPDPLLLESLPLLEGLRPIYEDFMRIPKRKRETSPERGAIEDLKSNIDSLLKLLDPENGVLLDDTSKEVSLYLHSLAGIAFQPVQLSTFEFKSLPWCFLDTEKKFWAYEHAKNCHIALLYKHADGSIEGQVHTTEHPGVDRVHATVNGSVVDFRVFSYESDISMVAGAVDSMRQRNPAVIAGHNIPYDFRELRSIKEVKSHKAFPVGLDDAEPVTKVALDFFRRMDCKGKVIIDTLRLARIIDPHLPCYDLETVALINKAITYQAFDSLAKNGDHVSAQELSRYVASDVLALYHHVFHGPWRDRLDPMIKAAHVLGVSPTESSHSPSCAERLRDRQFFEDVGTYRQSKDGQAIMVKMGRRFKRAWPSKRDRLLSEITQASFAPPGRYEHVKRMYIPLESVMMSKTACNFPTIGPLIRDWFDLPDAEKLAVCQYYKGLTVEPWLHWYYVKLWESRARKMAKTIGVPWGSVEGLMSSFWSRYRRNDLAKDRQANLDMIRGHFDQSQSSFDIRKVLDLALHSRRAAERFSSRHSYSVKEWEEKARSYAHYLHESLSGPSNSSVRMIHLNGQWLYVQGDLVIDPYLAPLIPVDEVTLLKFSYKGEDKIVFKQRDRYQGVRLSQKKPSNLTLYEVKYCAAIIDLLLEDKAGERQQVFDRGRAFLAMEQVPLEQLLFAVPKSGGRSFLGVDRKGERVFNYGEREDGLAGFNPDWDFYRNRFDKVVGRWLTILETKP